MESYKKVNIATDLAFQRKFNRFYRIKQRTENFYKEYYNYFEKYKNKEVGFEETLLYFHSKHNRVEASFSSKLIGTINPDLPVLAKYVLENMGLKLPYNNDKNRIPKLL